MTKRFLFAGFGGQGVLFAGKVLAYAGLCEGYNVTWLPSYGPETRGGTSNCSVVISDNEIGSPLVAEPDILVAMNRPSYDKHAADIADGGALLADLTFVDCDGLREDISSISIPATAIAEENGLSGLSNMVLLGKLFKQTDIISRNSIRQAVEKSVSAARKDLISRNILAIELGQKH